MGYGRRFVFFLCLLFNITAAVESRELTRTLSEGTIAALGCLGGALIVALVLGLTCFLIRRYRRTQFLQHKKEQEFLHTVKKDFSESLSSSKLSTPAKMTLLYNGPIPLRNDPIPTRGASVQRYRDWVGHQPQPSPVLYTKRLHEGQPTQRVFTVQQSPRTVITQRPKLIVRQNRATSAPPPLIRTSHATHDRYGYTNSHFLPVRAYVPATSTHLTKRYVTQLPVWRQEVVRPPFVEEVIQSAPHQEVIRPPPTQYVETITTQAPAPAYSTHRSSAGSTYHVKLNTHTMTYSKEKLGGSTGDLIESTSYRDRTYTDPDYVVTTGSSTYKPTVFHGGYQISPTEETSGGWTVVRGNSEGDNYRVSGGQWTVHDTEAKTHTAGFVQDDDAVFIQQIPEPTAVEVSGTSQTKEKKTYEEVVIVDYVEDSKKQDASPLSTSTPRFPERSPIDDVLTDESSGSESDSGHNESRRQRKPSSGE